MLQNSFIVLPKMGLKKEQGLWNQGILHWDNFLQATQAQQMRGISTKIKGYYDQQLHEAKKALFAEDSFYFQQRLKSNQMWRLYEAFKDQAVFLDIETSGYYRDITVIGMYDGYDTKTMVKGFTFDKKLLKKTLEAYKLLVTFNGSSFDLPIIERFFQQVVPKIPHIDLRHVCAKLGWTGGLKQIEKQQGIQRDPAVQTPEASDPVYLWQQYQATGEKEYLNTLVKYNEEDVINLKPLAEQAIKRLWNYTYPPHEPTKHHAPTTQKTTQTASADEAGQNQAH